MATATDNYINNYFNRVSSGPYAGWLNPKYPGSFTPQTDSSGLITGYSHGPEYPKPAPVQDPTHYDPITGKNYAGRTPGEQAAFEFSQNTAQVKVTKNPEIQQQQEKTLGDTSGVQAAIVKSFDDYMKEAKALQQQGAADVAKDRATYNQLPAKLESQLSDTVQQFADTAGNIGAKYDALNAQQKQQNAADIAAVQAENARYEAASKAVAERAVLEAQKQSNVFHSTTGTPTSGSGYWNELAAKTTSGIMLPVEQQISQSRLAQQMQYITPLHQQEYAQNLSKITGLDFPVAHTLVQLGVTNAQTMGQFSAALAGRSFEEQMRLLSSWGIPMQTAIQVLHALPGALTQLSALDQMNTNYGVVQNYQAPNLALPTYSPRYPDVGPGVGPGASPGGYPPGYAPQPGMIPGRDTTVNPILSGGASRGPLLGSRAPLVYTDNAGNPIGGGPSVSPYDDLTAAGAWSGGQFIPAGSYPQEFTPSYPYTG